MERAAESLGARALPGGAIEQAVAAIDARAAIDAIMVAVAGPTSPALEALLARLQLECERAGIRSVVSLPWALVDLGWALMPHPDIALLCDPAPHETIAAVREVLAHRPLAAVREGEPPGALLRLSEEVGRIASRLAALSEQDVPYNPPPSARSPRPGAPSAASIRAVIRARRLRERFLEPALFADPAWDILLDLMAARLEGTAVSVSSLCIAAAVPTTTGLRWIKTLTDAGLLTRVADPDDRRRYFVALADPVADAIAAYFAALDEQDPSGA